MVDDAVKEREAVLAEAAKQDADATTANSKSMHDAQVLAARSVFGPGEVGPDGTTARRLAHPGEVTDANGLPNPFGSHVNLGTAFEPRIVPMGELNPATAHDLGLPMTTRGSVAPDAPPARGNVASESPPAPDNRRDTLVEKSPTKA